MFKPLSDADAERAVRWRPPEIPADAAHARSRDPARTEAVANAVLSSLALQGDDGMATGDGAGDPDENPARSGADGGSGQDEPAPEPEAMARAFDEGFAAGSVAAREELSADFASLAASLSVDASIVLDRLEDEVVELARAMAEAMLRRELGRSPDDLRRLVREALEPLADEDAVTVVRLHPVDAALIVAGEGGIGARVKIVADDSLARADCRLAAGAAHIDADLVTRLRMLGGEAGADVGAEAEADTDAAGDDDEEADPDASEPA